jgi:putative intracellular protease/amidase
LYEGVTALDAVGPYEVLSRVGRDLGFVGHAPGSVRTDTGRLGLSVDTTFEEVEAPEVVVVPGGPGQVALMHDERLLDWLRRVHRTTQWTTSVCTGALILGAAGLLQGKRATTYWLAMDQLDQHGAEPVRQRVVVDGKIVTSAGVSSGIDMALRLAALMVGDEGAQAVQLGIEYAPDPPFAAGSPDTAPPHIVETLRSLSRFILEPTD